MAQCITNTFVQGKPLIPLPTKNLQNQQGKKVGNFVVVSKKKDIHPNFYEDAKVYCNNELVMTTGGTQKEYVVDVWSGNHQFYLGNRSANMVSDDQVEKFRKKYGELAEIMEIPVLQGEIVIPSRRKGIKGGGGGKKKK
ncbi:50S ribosomal protein L31, chloroplastic isoform X1 [Trifolium pratense]|uniref:50S ribosomal protein L31, chloroplastic isoform X1 n=1 Tax=Trifolium pratense TaxID=57577 RepID=UPI001E693A9E|nr:50S ribosomal protein L31, chloroplastic isoform X1 [Trifolium pratense]